MAKDIDPEEVEARNPSRIIEYFPPGPTVVLPGPTVVAIDCTYAGKTYSKGSVVWQGGTGDSTEDGVPMECTGDSQGTWKLHVDSPK
jgi:hypothetical protein